MTYALKIYFAGTGRSAAEIKRERKVSEAGLFDSSQEEKIIRIYFSGCQEKVIGGRIFGLGYLTPDLMVVTEKLKRCFQKHDHVFFDAQKLKKIFSESVLFDDVAFIKTNPLSVINDIEIDNIHLYGYSRGAVTAFLVARELNALAVDMEIYAEEPIPGESKMGFKKSLGKKGVSYNAYHLQHCQYIKKATVILGDHSHLNEPGIWYRQMSPIFHRSTQADIYLISKNSHSCLGFYGESQLKRHQLPEKMNVSNTYYQHLLSLGLNELCDCLNVVVYGKEERSSDTCFESESDDVLDSLSANDVFYGHSLRIELLPEPVFLPRTLKKSYHFGVLGRVQCALSSKQWYQLKYQAFYLGASSFGLKQYQSLCALCLNTWEKPQEQYPCLIQRISDESGDLSQNIALRDFIVEMSRTFNYFKQQAPHLPQIMEQFTSRVWGSLENIVSIEGLGNWQIITVCLNDLLKKHQRIIGIADYLDLRNALQEILKTNALEHPTLTKFLKTLDDERVTSEPKIAQSLAYDAEPKTAFELTRNVFFSTVSRREIIFNECKNQLASLNLSLENVIDLSILLNVKQAKELLSLPAVKQLIKGISSQKVLAIFIEQLPAGLNSSLAKGIGDSVKLDPPENYVDARALVF